MSSEKSGKRASVKSTMKPRGRSVGPKSKSKDKSVKKRPATGKSLSGKDGAKKRKAVGKDGKPSAKRLKDPSKPKKSRSSEGEGAADGSAHTEGEAKAPKVSARKIDVEWKPRMQHGVRTLPFRRLLNFYAHQLLADMRMAQGVAHAIRSVVEEYVVHHLHQASVVAMHAKRNTVNANDIELQVELSKQTSGDNGDLMAWMTNKVGAIKRKSASSKPRDPSAATDGAASAPKVKKPKASKKKSSSDSSTGVAADGGVVPDGSATAMSAPVPVTVAA